MIPPLRIGTAGWNVPSSYTADVPVGGSHLERYAAVFRGVEINSSFYRPHAAATYAKWRDSTPAGFRFAVKMPRTITHELKLQHAREPFVAFLVGAVVMQILFGFCRALGGVVAQSSLMTIVPRHFMGRTQSAMAILTTVVQLFMSFALGWVAQGAGLVAGYAMLALLYTGATVSAIRARQLMQ